MTEILPIRRKTLSNQSINQCVIGLVMHIDEIRAPYIFPMYSECVCHLIFKY